MAILASGEMPPLETHRKSRPMRFSSRPNATASAGSTPPAIQSEPVMRIPSGRSLGHTARTASATSSRNRIRAARLPPYPSVRLFELVEAETQRAPCGLHVGVADALDVGAGHLARSVPVGGERNG